MAEQSAKHHPRIPTATYRLQFNHQFTLRQAAAVSDYLHALGISDIYASPLTTARRGSLHGYDVTDHTRLNPELGTQEDFNDFANRLRQHGMGLVMDVVPNHMCIAGSGNQWWNDVLENGPGSVYARFFDVDWHPPKQNLDSKVLLPVLGDQYGRVLENQQIQLHYQRGAFYAQYYETRLPIAPRTSSLILRSALARVSAQLAEDNPHCLELESIITALSHLPPRTETDPEKIRERRREKEIIKRRLAALTAASATVQRAIKEVITEFNGTPGAPHSFDRLEELLAEQAYRLCFWRVAADEINYRRFFDINELAAIRVEEPKVFAAVHELIFRLMKEGHVTGLRVDHIDGLAEPEQYLRDLQRGARRALRSAGQNIQTSDRACYVVVEKILGPDEHLPSTWAADGTTGYDFLNLLNGVFIETQHAAAFGKLYQRFTGQQQTFADVAYEGKKLVLHAAMSGELHVLARRLDRISEQHRYSRDFTLNSLQSALAEVIACFPVYRSYVRRDEREVSDDDRRHITRAIRQAKRRNPSVSPSIYDFIESLLLLRDPEGLTEKQREERREFVLRFQQLTGPVTAKGVEDTAFYRYYPLASLCEVGGEPSQFGLSVIDFHRRSEERLRHWPHTMLATSTHDTKRSEDVRARLNALSEIPARWYRAVLRWERLNREHKALIEDALAPDANEEYLLYQTLVGAWPLAADAEAVQEEFIRRIEEYMLKALKEARVHSSWINSNEEYEQAMRRFVRAVLTPGSEFRRDFCEFIAPVVRAGMFNSLSQTLLKIAAPGVPDFYQGTELWDFSLVDPDNRRPVDYELRKRLLASLDSDEQRDQRALADELLRRSVDGRIKLFVTSRALNYRRANRQLFERGAYVPLTAAGERERHVVAFARSSGGQLVVAVATRFLMNLPEPVGGAVWNDTEIILPAEFAGCYRDVFTGSSSCARTRPDACALPLAEICAHLPVALLERVS
ncbi:MAG TPA: malto-oligosyltrehalose synthase [Blastocatellia bacterium]|nr:malto-oligosyltrehalose synthase [Blastocatellia bacterium]